LLLRHREIPKTTSPITHPRRPSTLRRGRRTEGSKGRGESEDVVKGRRPKDKDGDFQHRDSFIRRSGRRKCFSWAGSSNRWSSANRDSSRKSEKHLTFVSSFSENEETDDDRNTLLRSKPGKPKSSARRGRSTTKRYKVDSVRRERRTNREGSRHSQQAKSESTTASSFESTSSDEEHDTKTTAVTRPKHILKPPKFDGTTSFETFWAQFQNCVRHNRWDRSTELVYLRNSLNKDVANVLWDYKKEVTESLSGLTKILKMRFRGKTFADKHRIEIRNRRRQNGETLPNLHSAIRRLAALAFSDMEYRSREMISTDYFLDALANPDFALKVRERHP